MAVRANIKGAPSAWRQGLAVAVGISVGALTALGLISLATPAKAQVLSPMESYVAAQSDVFLVKVDISNPYKQAQISEITLLNDGLEPIEPLTMTAPPRIHLASGETKTVSILVPFEDGRRSRIIYVCHAIQPKRRGHKAQGSTYKGEVCGKVSAFKLS